MKTNSKTMLQGALAVAALVVCGPAFIANAAVPVSPVGTWDCTLTGAHGQKGITFLTFSDDGTNRTFDGFEILLANTTSSTADINVRNFGEDQGRSILGGSVTSSSSTSGTNSETLVGFGEISGPWSYDNKGRIV